VIAAPTGAGKTSAMAKAVAREGGTCWLSDRRDDVDAAAAAIDGHSGNVGKVLPLDGVTGGVPNCLHPEIISSWQSKGYNYHPGYCKVACERGEDIEECPFIMSIKELKDADNIVVTKALARRGGFFSTLGNQFRQTVVLDEDPIGLLRPPVEVTYQELNLFQQTLDEIDTVKNGESAKLEACLNESRRVRRIGSWCLDQIKGQQPGGQPEAFAIPPSLLPTKAVLKRTKQERKNGRKILTGAFHKRMRNNPHETIRNVLRDLYDLVARAAGKIVFVTAEKLVFHLQVKIPRNKRVIILDATANADLLRPIFAPRPIIMLCQERVKPAGRVIQFMDFNGPRSYLNKIPRKAVKIIDAIGDLHPGGQIVLISHQSCVNELAKASRHSERIKTAYFGALRGRNDLESSPEQLIACHIVAGSPKTTEENRQQLALAVYGKGCLPLPPLVTVRRPILGRVPAELDEGEDTWRVWEAKFKGYNKPEMQAVYEHTATAELTHAADRARVLIHESARVYLLTNELCPRLWFAEMAYAGELLDLTPGPRSDFRQACERYMAKAKELLDRGQRIGNADVCRALSQKPGWGKRYWVSFLEQNKDALEGRRKVRWKEL
jgi:hypothetical protein